MRGLQKKNNRGPHLRSVKVTARGTLGLDSGVVCHEYGEEGACATVRDESVVRDLLEDFERQGVEQEESLFAAC